MSQQDAETLFAHLWRDFATIAPQAAHIHDLLESRGERFTNDHVALRTFDAEAIRKEVLAAPFVRWGYQQTGEYFFKERKLRAVSYSHPSKNLPRVFISELVLSSCSASLQKHVQSLIEHLPEDVGGDQLLGDQSLWPAVQYHVYRELLEESEYAAWVAAFGIRANHFTINFNDLKTFASLQSLNEFLVARGFELNSPSAPIQGSPSQLLEQSSTRADHIEWPFADGKKHMIRSCYYEFCRRYRDPASGQWYDGFITKNADKIFESTNVHVDARSL